MALAEAGLQRRKRDPLGQQPALLAQIAKRVLGELPQRLGHPAPLFCERGLELARLKRPARYEAGSVLEDARPADGHVVAVGQLVEELRVRGVDQPHPTAHQQERPRIRETAGLRVRDIGHDADSRLEQLLRGCAVEVLVVDDRDVAGPEPPDEVLRPATEACSACELDEAHGPSWTAEMNASPPSIRRISSFRCPSSSGSIRVCVGSPGTFSTRKWRSARLAICGRGGIVTICARPDRRRRRSPAACAGWAPIAAALSSKTSGFPPPPPPAA